MLRKTILSAAVLVAALLPAVVAAGDPRPSKPFRIVVSSVPGGGSDIAARTLAPQLGEALRAQVLVDNRPGPTGNVAAEAVAKAPPDGYTLLLATSTLTITPAVSQRLNYDPAKDFVPVGALMSVPLVLLAPPSLRVKTVKELVAFAKTQPGALNYGYTGLGASDRLCAELFAKAAGMRVVGVAYKDEAASGRIVFIANIHYMFASIAYALPHVKAGDARGLAIATAQRYPLLPSVPAVSETLPGFEFPVWQVLVAPARTPPAVLREIERAAAKTMESKDVVERLKTHGIQPIAATSEELHAFLPREISRWSAVVREANLRVD